MTVPDTVPYALLSLIAATGLLLEAYALILHLRERRHSPRIVERIGDYTRRRS